MNRCVDRRRESQQGASRRCRELGRSQLRVRAASFATQFSILAHAARAPYRPLAPRRPLLSRSRTSCPSPMREAPSTPLHRTPFARARRIVPALPAPLGSPAGRVRSPVTTRRCAVEWPQVSVQHSAVERTCVITHGRRHRAPLLEVALAAVGQRVVLEHVDRRQRRRARHTAEAPSVKHRGRSAPVVTRSSTFAPTGQNILVPPTTTTNKHRDQQPAPIPTPSWSQRHSLMPQRHHALRRIRLLPTPPTQVLVQRRPDRAPAEARP